MSLYIKDKKITSVRYNNRIINSIWKGATLLWEAVKSCFSKGFWIQGERWSNNDGWKN